MRPFGLTLVGLTLMACSNLADSGTGPTDDPELPAPAVGALTGRVYSKELGVMSGIRVVANSGDRIATTNDRGVWSMDGLTPGLVALQLANLPPTCKLPEPRAVDLNPGGTVRVRFLVDCSGSSEGGIPK